MNTTLLQGTVVQNLSTTTAGGAIAVPSTEPPFSFLVSLALTLLPQQMAAKKIALGTND